MLIFWISLIQKWVCLVLSLTIANDMCRHRHIDCVRKRCCCWRTTIQACWTLSAGLSWPVQNFIWCILNGILASLMAQEISCDSHLILHCQGQILQIVLIWDSSLFRILKCLSVIDVWPFYVILCCFLVSPSCSSHGTLCFSGNAARLAALHKLQACWLDYINEPPNQISNTTSNTIICIEKSLYCG